jgi:hypothetical protein
MALAALLTGSTVICSPLATKIMIRDQEQLGHSDINQCFFNMVQYYRCEPEGENYFATVDMREPGGNRIDDATLTQITAANEKSHLKVKGRLTKELTIVGRTKNGKGFAEFQYGDYKWNLDEPYDAKKDGSCDAPPEWIPGDFTKCKNVHKRQFYAEDKDPQAVAVGFPPFWLMLFRSETNKPRIESDN